MATEGQPEMGDITFVRRLDERDRSFDSYVANGNSPLMVMITEEALL